MGWEDKGERDREVKDSRQYCLLSLIVKRGENPGRSSGGGGGDLVAKE